MLADLKDQIRCDQIVITRYDSRRRRSWSLQGIPALCEDELKAIEDQDPAQHEHYWACHLDSQPCSYPERTGDLRSVVTIGDFYSAWQWRSTAMYCDFYRPWGSSMSLCCACPILRN